MFFTLCKIITLCKTVDHKKDLNIPNIPNGQPKDTDLLDSKPLWSESVLLQHH